MIYLDTSVALAHLLAEDRRPPEHIWKETMVSSRLLEYEVWTRIHALERGKSLGEAVRLLLGRVAMIELLPMVLARAVEAFPRPVRTLDALHLASIEYLRGAGQEVSLASYDNRLVTAARSLRIPIADLTG